MPPFRAADSVENHGVAMLRFLEEASSAAEGVVESEFRGRMGLEDGENFQGFMHRFGSCVIAR